MPGPSYAASKKFVTTPPPVKDQTEDSERGSEFPVHTGGGWYELSNGEKVRGEEDALKAEKKLG